MTTKQIQSLLTYLGYDCGTVDGLTGPKTVAAVEAFQSAEGLMVDGIAGGDTEAALLAAVADGRFCVEEESNCSEKANSSEAPGTFWDDIKHFTRAEFKCQCGGKYCNGYPAEPSETLLRAAEDIRGQIGKPMIITSGLRCPTHNAEVGGVSNSRHISGKAMDFYATGMTAAQLLTVAQAHSSIRYAYAINDRCIHMDVL